MVSILRKHSVMGAILRKLRALFESDRAMRRRQVDSIPRFLIQEKHVDGGEILLNRGALIRKMPRGGTVAEIGVDEGNFSQEIIQLNNPRRLHLIDAWGSQRYNELKARRVLERFDENIASGTVIVNRGSSLAEAEQFDDEYFDWVYLDTSHSYHATLSELYAYSNKVKKSGFIAGHDYKMGNWKASLKYGVIEAVAEFCCKEDWRLAFWTADFAESNSFAITRIGS